MQRFIAGVYFPPTNQDFKSIQEKYIHDLGGVKKNNVNGLYFFTNQRISPNERKLLEDIAIFNNTKSEIYHILRIQSMLDSPKYYGIRLEYLRIAMKDEEQFSFWSVWKDEFRDVINKNTEHLVSLNRKIDDMRSTQSEILKAFFNKTTEFNAEEYHAILSKIDVGPLVTKKMSIQLLFLINRIVCLSFKPPITKWCGKFRTLLVWIGKPGATIESATFVPPRPGEIAELIVKLLKNWNNNFDTIKCLSTKEIIKYIADFHYEFLRIHPFLDGNGTTAWFILNQQINDLFENDLIIEIGKVQSEYYRCLEDANKGNMLSLYDLFEKLIAPCVS
jgi:fido (protein-threonine AMPylation protein)